MKKREWNEEELNFLRENFDQKTLADIATILKRSNYGVSCKMNELGLKRRVEVDVELVKECANRLGESLSVYDLANEVFGDSSKKSLSALRLAMKKAGLMTKRQRLQKDRKELAKQGMGICFTCGETKPLADFAKGSGKYEHSTRCKKCVAMNTHKYYQERK